MEKEYNLLNIVRKEDDYDSPQAEVGQVRQSRNGDIVLVIRHVYVPRQYGRNEDDDIKKELKLLYLSESEENKIFHTNDSGIPHSLFIEKEYPYVLDATLTAEER